MSARFSAVSARKPARTRPASITEACVWSVTSATPAAAATATPVWGFFGGFGGVCVGPPWGVPCTGFSVGRLAPASGSALLPDPGALGLASSSSSLTTEPATVKDQIFPPTMDRTLTFSSTSMPLAGTAGVPGAASTSLPISARVRRSMSATATEMPTPSASPLVTPPAHIALVCRLAA